MVTVIAAMLGNGQTLSPMCLDDISPSREGIDIHDACSFIDDASVISGHV
jgi:hypothetical protein